MPDTSQTVANQLQQRFSSQLRQCVVAHNEVTIEVAKQDLHEVCLALRDEADFHFEILIDLCGVDYSQYGEQPWHKERFAAVYHLLSIKNNQRLRLRVRLDENDLVVDSVVSIWAVANWFEREAFDMFGILFAGHPDLRRLLTDYGFIGHPFRKDFPLIGNVEMRYDPEKRRVVYQPVTIEPRITVPRVIRHDHRYVSDEVNNG